jgi:hypothetical protein
MILPSLPQISTVRSEVVQLDSRLTETSSGLRRDVDQIRKEMEDVVLKEMKQQLEEVYRRVGQEEAARKLVRGGGEKDFLLRTCLSLLLDPFLECAPVLA